MAITIAYPVAFLLREVVAGEDKRDEQVVVLSVHKNPFKILAT
jgi:hypothetical protein